MRSYLRDRLCFLCNAHGGTDRAWRSRVRPVWRSRLNPDIPRGDVIIPRRAIREEGASYHYLSPSTYVGASPELTEKLIEAFQQKGFPMHVGDTWTTDAIYRETKSKIAKYREADVLSVEMEAAAHFAIAKYRGIEAAAVFYAGDCVERTHGTGAKMQTIACRKRKSWK